MRKSTCFAAETAVTASSVVVVAAEVAAAGLLEAAVPLPSPSPPFPATASGWQPSLSSAARSRIAGHELVPASYRKEDDPDSGDRRLTGVLMVRSFAAGLDFLPLPLPPSLGVMKTSVPVAAGDCSAPISPRRPCLPLLPPLDNLGSSCAPPAPVVDTLALPVFLIASRAPLGETNPRPVPPPSPTRC